MFKTILVAVDVNHEPSAKKSLAAAATVAKASGGEIHVLSVVPDLDMPIVAQYFPKDFEEKAVARTREELDALCKAEEMHATPHVVVGRIYAQILEQAEKLKADLIVLASHTSTLEGYLVGSNARKVVAHAAQSVLVVRD